MPSGDPEEHKYWCDLHPSGFGDIAAMKFLSMRGYRNSPTKPFHWVLPMGQLCPTEEEARAIRYLICEWDFGDIVPE